MLRRKIHHPLSIGSQVFIIITLLLCTFSSCNKEIEEPTNPKNPPVSKQPDKYFITTIVGKETDLGLIINDPISGMQYAASGPKNEQGKMDTIIFIVESEPETGEWMAHELNENYTPNKTTTSTGHTIEYTDLEPATKTGSVKVKETSSGNTVWEGKNIKFNNNFFESIEEAQIKGPHIKRKRGANGAEMLYLLTSMAGCGMGVIGLSMGPLALPWGIYNTYQNCKSAKDAAENLYKGKPAFGCITTTDNANALSGFAETISQGGGFGNLATGLLPALVNYGAQHSQAGQCDDEDDNDDGNGDDPLGVDGDNGDGSNDGFWDNPFGGPGGSWGDPHLSTPDGLLYDFHGYGEFVLTKSTTDNFEVQVRLGNPYSTFVQATLNTGVAIQTGSDVVSIIANPQKLYINNTVQDLNFDILPLKGGAGIKREIDKNYQILTIRSKNGDLVKVRLDGGSYFDFDVTIKETRKGKILGLLGNYDGNKYNDLQLSSGASVEKSFSSMYPKYADSWRVEGVKSLFYYEAGTSTETFTKKDFPKAPFYIPNDKLKWAEAICLQAGITDEPYLTNCTCDVASTEDPSMAKSAVWEAQKQIANSLPPLDISKVQLQGEAKVIGNFIRLTEAKLFQAGQAFFTSPLTGDFETEFTFKIPYNKNGSDDGFALVIAKDIPQLKGNPYPGSSGKLGYEGVKASLAVEFDTWANAASDESGNHVAIHTNGKETNSTGHTTRLIYNNKIVPLADGMFHIVKIRYKNKSILVFLDGAQVLEKGVDLVEKLGLEGSFYIGITSSTSGGNAGSHNIGAWSVKNL